MKKSLLFLALFVSNVAMAGQYQTTITSAKCTEIAKGGSAAGAIAGSGIGGAIGGALGKSLFGKSGGIIGGIAGGIAGGVAGENLGASITYSCVVGFVNPKGKQLYAEVLGPNRSVGEAITVFEQDDGKVLVK